MSSVNFETRWEYFVCERIQLDNLYLSYTLTFDRRLFLRIKGALMWTVDALVGLDLPQETTR